MIDMSLKVLSNEIKISVKELIKHFSEIGILKDENDFINISEKNFLLKHLRKKENISKNTFILQRKTRGTLNMSLASGKNKSIKVEIRKKRTYIKSNISETQSLPKDKISPKNKRKNFLKPFIKNTIKDNKLHINRTILNQNKLNKDYLSSNESDQLNSLNTIKKMKKVKS